MTRRLIAATVSAALLACCASASAATPTDPQAGAQEPLRILRVGEALDLAGRPLADVPVLVADTGLDLDHPDIASRLFSLPAAVPAPNPGGDANPPTVAAGAPGWDLLGGAAPGGDLAPDADPSDVGGHGTAVAGVLGAAWNNGQGGAGVAPNARFVAMRSCWPDDQCYQYIQDDAIRWAIDRGARVVSFSWLSGPLEADLRAAIADHPNVLFVGIPSGNGGAYDADPENPLPCNLDVPNVLCVSTSAPDDGLDCGAFGPSSVDVAVPTRNSVTTTNGGGSGPTDCATSYAAPMAAGIATILFGIDPGASAADVRAAIVDSARRVPAWAGKSVSGGIADAAAAVRLFQDRRGIATPVKPPVTQPPTPQRGAPVLTARRSGSRVSVVLSEAARVRIAVEHARSGRVVGGRCRSARRGKRCTRWVQVGSARTHPLARGTTRLAIPTSSSSGRRLAAGSYRLVLLATDADGNRSQTIRVSFKVGS